LVLVCSAHIAYGQVRWADPYLINSDGTHLGGCGIGWAVVQVVDTRTHLRRSSRGLLRRLEMTSPTESLGRLIAAVNAHDLEAISSLAPGNERFRESFRRLLTAFPDVQIDIEWTVAEASKAVAWSHLRGTHNGEWRGLAPTGRAIDVHGVFVVQVTADGQISDFWLVNDWLGIATQLGVELVLPAQ
jgi:steroid delta-isomerase-like uncharacterized protein